jgi:hypothetical protein
MASYEAILDGVCRIVLAPAIVRAFWTKRCAWPGDTVGLRIETRHVPDGTRLHLAVLEDDSDEGSPDDAIAELPPAEIVGNKCAVEYTLDWNAMAQAGDLEVEGDAFEFVFDASIADFGLVRRSTRLYVPVEPFRISR